MADRMQQYADWLIANQNRKGTPEFNTVANAYKALRQQPQAAPDTSFSSAFQSGIDAPLENIAKTADMLGYEGTAETLSNLTQAPANYESASNRFINPQEGDATIAGFGYEYLPRAAAEQAGQFAGSIISRTAGGLAGGALTGGNPVGVAAGAFAAPAMFEFVQQLGGNAQERARNNGREEPNADDWQKAAAAAGMSGVLNAFGVGSTGLFNRILREGFTEAAQSGVQQTGVSLGTEAGLKLDTKQAVGEGIIGGTAAGGMSLPGSATSAAVNLVSGGDTKVGDQQAASDVANDLQRIADAAGHDLMDVDPSSAGGAKQAVMDVHAEYAETMKALAADIKTRLGYEDSDTEAQRLDKILAKTALRKGRNVAKNIVNKDDFAAVQRLAGDTAEGQQLINMLKRSNELTRVNDAGYKGGLSRITDVFNPFDMNQGYSPARNTVSAMSGLLSGGAAISTQGLSVIPQAAAVGTGRLIDAATGRRSRVARYIKQNAGKQGLAAPDSPSLRLAREAEKNNLAATQSTADVISKARKAVQASQAKALNRQLDATNAPPTLNSPQYIMEDATGLDKSGVNLMLAKLEQMENINPALKKAIEEYRASVREGGIIEDKMLSPLIRAVNAAVDSAPENQALMVRERNALSQPQVQGAPTSISQNKIETGKRDNQAFVEQLRTRMEADETVPDKDKVMINRALDLLAKDLGSDPVAMAERVLDEAYSKVNRAPAVTDYVLPYVNRVRQQQSGKKSKASDGALTEETTASLKLDDDTSVNVIAFHGSPEVFDVFDMSKAADGAHFFTDSKTAAGNFGVVRPYRIRMSNPFVTSQQKLEDMVTEQDEDAGILPRDKIAGLVQQAKQMGHDGIVIKNFADALETEADTYLPFDSKQIENVQPGEIIKEETNAALFDPIDTTEYEDTVYYHGTSQMFEEFDASKLGSSTRSQSAKEAFWFSDDTRTAESYADYNAGAAQIDALLAQARAIEGDARIAQSEGRTEDAKRLFEQSDEINRQAEDLDREITFFPERGQTLIPVRLPSNLHEIDAEGDSYADFRSVIRDELDFAKRNGYDGLKIYNLSDNADWGRYQPSTHVAIFDPAKIRSKFAPEQNANKDAPKLRITNREEADQLARHIRGRNLRDGLEKMLQKAGEGMLKHYKKGDPIGKLGENFDNTKLLTRELVKYLDPEGRETVSKVQIGLDGKGISDEDIKVLMPHIVRGLSFVQGSDAMDGGFLGQFRTVKSTGGVVFKRMIDMVDIGEKLSRSENAEIMTGEMFLETLLHEIGHGIEGQTPLRDLIATTQVLASVGDPDAQKQIEDMVRISKLRRVEHWQRLERSLIEGTILSDQPMPRIKDLATWDFNKWLEFTREGRQNIVDRGGSEADLQLYEKLIPKAAYKTWDYLSNPAELGADLVAYYFSNPAELKKQFPLQAKMVRKAVNESDLSQYITFHTVAGLLGAGAISSILLGMDGEDEDDKGILSLGRGALSAA